MRLTDLLTRIIYLSNRLDKMGLTVEADTLDVLMRTAEKSWMERREPFYKPTDDTEFTEALEKKLVPSDEALARINKKQPPKSEAEHYQRMVDMPAAYPLDALTDKIKDLYTWTTNKAKEFLSKYEELLARLRAEDQPSKDILTMIKICQGKVDYYKKTMQDLNTPTLKDMPNKRPMTDSRHPKPRTHQERLSQVKDHATAANTMKLLLEHLHDIIKNGRKTEKNWPARYDSRPEPKSTNENELPKAHQHPQNPPKMLDQPGFASGPMTSTRSPTE